LKGLGFGCDEEALRVVSAFPNWIPGSQDGKPVAVKFNLPIHFQIEESKKVSADNGQAQKLVTEKAIDQRAAKEYVPKANDTLLFSQTSPPLRIIGQKNAIKTGSEPVVVIDGKVMKDQYILSDLNPNSIESISILKDQSTWTTATYGPLSKNGVVIITTKKSSPVSK